MVMATSKHPSKPGKSWKISELEAYKIRINTVDTQTFFGIANLSNLPEPDVDPIIFESVDEPSFSDELPYDLRIFFVYLHDTTDKSQPAFVDNFTVHLLGRVLRFDQPRGITHPRATFSFIMSGRRVSAMADVALRRGDYQTILVQKDKTSRERAEPRLVATALGAFSTDNDKRAANGLAPIDSKMYIGIVTIGSAPFFYKITITQALVDMVMKSQCPAQETIFERFIPPVKDVDDFVRDGMLTLDNRRVCFQCYEALRGLL